LEQKARNYTDQSNGEKLFHISYIIRHNPEFRATIWYP
jgi:hypothetical protein